MINKYSNLENFFMTHIAVDEAMLKRLSDFRLSWSMRRIDATYSNLDFLSGIPIGVQNVRFSSLDEYRLANEVFRYDAKAVQMDLYRVEGIVKEWVVTSNVYYQTLLYIFRYVYLNKLDVRYALDAYLVMAYKMVTSLLSNRYSDYALDPRIASRLVETMSNKFIVKELGSWAKYFEYRASFLYPGTSNYDLLMNKYSAESSILIISDLQSNLRSTVNRMQSLVVELTNSDLKIDSSSVMKMEAEEMVVSDIEGSMGRYITRAVNAINGADFVNDNYVYLISEISSNLNTIAFKSMLLNVNTISLSDFKLVESIVTDIMTTSIKYLSRNNSLAMLDTSTLGVLRLLKAYFSSSKVSDPLTISVKKRSMDLVMRSSKVKTSWTLTSMNINFILYVVLSALVKGR